tara:strand:- start:1986 stop:3503 length:1518 start_codon:yes stop_codon:yes gene_type:complete
MIKNNTCNFNGLLKELSKINPTIRIAQIKLLNKNCLTQFLANLYENESGNNLKTIKTHLKIDEQVFGCLTLPKCIDNIKILYSDREYQSIVFSVASEEYKSKLTNLIFSNLSQISNNSKKNLIGNWLISLKMKEVLIEKNEYVNKKNEFINELVKDYKEQQNKYDTNVAQLFNAKSGEDWRTYAKEISKSIVIGTFITSYLCKNPEFDSIWEDVQQKLKARSEQKPSWIMRIQQGSPTNLVKSKGRAKDITLVNPTIENILSDLQQLQDINKQYMTHNLQNSLWDTEIKFYEKLKAQLIDNLSIMENSPELYIRKNCSGEQTLFVNGRYYNTGFRNTSLISSGHLQNKRTILPMLFLSLNLGLGVGSCIDNTIMTYVGMANHTAITKQDFLNIQFKRNQTHFECRVPSGKTTNHYSRMPNIPFNKAFNIITTGSFYRHLELYSFANNNKSKTSNLEAYSYNKYKIPLLKEFLYKSFNLDSIEEQQSFSEYVFRKKCKFPNKNILF